MQKILLSLETFYAAEGLAKLIESSSEFPICACSLLVFTIYFLILYLPIFSQLELAQFEVQGKYFLLIFCDLY